MGIARIVSIALILSGLWGDFAAAQGLFGRNVVRSGDELFLLAPRALQRMLSEGHLAIDEGRYTDGIDALYSLLQDPQAENDDSLLGQDFFTVHGEELYSEGLKREAAQILSRLPEAGRRTLELQYGVTARQALEDAIAERDPARVAWVARNYPHTEAGYDAWMLLAQRKLVDGFPLSAARIYQRLIAYPAACARYGSGLLKAAAMAWHQGDRTAAAVSVLERGNEYFPGASLEFSGQQLSLADPQDWLAILESTSEWSAPALTPQLAANWLTTGGSPNRAAVSSAGMPLSTARWIKEIHSNVLEKDALVEIGDSQSQRGNTLFPKFDLRLVDDLVLTKTTDASILAIDFKTGNIRWPFFRKGMPYAFAEQSFSTDFENAASTISPEIQDRVWGSSAYGQMSCDMERVYAVFDHGRETRSRGMQFETSNVLVGLSIPSEGTLLWTVGGEDGGSEPWLRNAYFLGPPLPYEGDLYCLVEAQGQMQLVVLDDETGRRLWSQQLAHSTFPPIAADSLRRSQALSPAISDGMLLCPTGLGALVAVDLFDRSLAWATYYGSNTPASTGEFIARSTLDNASDYNPMSIRWHDPTMLAQDGVVVVTPLELNRVICCDIFSGERRFAMLNRNHARYIAGIADGYIVAVGDRHLAWFRIADGKQILGPDYPDGRVVVGRGVWEGNELLLPLSGQAVVRVGTHHGSGEVLDMAQVDQPLGNLFAYKDQLISVSSTTVAAFYTRESLNKQLSDPTTDATPWSLNRRAQLSSAAGDTHGALDLLLKSYELDAANADTRYLLVETILTGMEEDFEKYQELARKFDKIIEYGPQRFRFLQQLTLGNIRSNQHLAAFSRLLDLVNDRVGSRFKMSQNRANQVAISENHQVDSDAWIISNLARSYAAASEEERAEIERLVALELADIDQWVLSIRHQKLRFFSWLPAAEPQLLLLAESLMSDQEWVSAEQVLVPLLASANAETVAAARQLLSRESSWDRKLLGYYGQYGSLIPDPTQRNPLDRLRSEMPQIELEPEPWNRGLALVSMNRESNYAEGMVVEQLSNRFGRPEVELRIVSEKLLIYSQNGQQVGRIRYDRATNDISDLSVKASVRGSLVVVNTHSEIVAFNLYAGLERDTDAMLWRQSLFGAGPTIRYEPRAAENVISDLGFPLDTRSNQSGQAVSVGPITVSGVPIQTGSKVMMLDGQSGRMVWSRDGFNRQVEFATLDSRLAILTYHADRTDVEIVDCRDGTTLAERKVPGGWTHWYSFNGLSVDFVQRFDGSGAGFEIPHTLRIWNPLDGEELLRLKLAAGARAEQCSQRHIAVLEPDGKMHLIDLADPSKAIHREHQVPVLGVLDTISLQKVGEQLVLLSNASGDRETSRDPLLFARGDSLRDRVPINGFVYGIDRDTLDLSWDRPGELYSFAFPTNQPRNSPFMALYRVRKLESTAELLLIDTRTGKLAYSSGAFLTRTPSGFTMTLNPFNQSLAIELGARLFKVEFTRMGRPPQPIVVSSLIHPKGS